MWKAWLEYIYDTFEEARIACGDYARIAAKADEDYIKYSPVVNSGFASSGVIEFDLNSPSAPETDTKILGGLSFSWLKIKAKNDIAKPLYWALSEKRKLERIIARFQTLRSKLQEVLPMYTASLVINSTKENARSTLSRMVKDPSSKVVGLTPHLRLRLLQSDPISKARDLDLVACRLESEESSSAVLTLGTLADGRGKITPSTQQSMAVLIEYKSYLPPPDAPKQSDMASYKSKVHSQVQRLANLLSSAGDDDLNTLSFKGYIDQQTLNRHAFVFAFPENANQSTPVSLRSIIEAEGPKRYEYRLTLNTRFAIAQSISKSLGCFHADGWVHKSLRSESIVFFKSKSTTETLMIGSPYLVNFEYTRPENAGTVMDYDLDIEKDIYRHPERQGIPSRPFSKAHDLYALGVILLEIGLWQSARSIYNGALRSYQGSSPSPAEIREMFLSLVRKKLAHCMGDSYANAVLACLSGAYEERTSQIDFSMTFYREVVMGLELK